MVKSDTNLSHRWSTDQLAQKYMIIGIQDNNNDGYTYDMMC